MTRVKPGTISYALSNEMMVLSMLRAKEGEGQMIDLAEIIPPQIGKAKLTLDALPQSVIEM